MRKLTLLLPIVALISCSALWAQAANPEPGAQALAKSQAQSWSGTLVDAACKEKDLSQKCPIGGTTKSYGLSSEGKFYKFDAAGNSAARRELAKAGSKSGDVSATVTGTLDGDTIKVQSIQIQ